MVKFMYCSFNDSLSFFYDFNPHAPYLPNLPRFISLKNVVEH